MIPPPASDIVTSPEAAATLLVRGIFVLGVRSLFIVRGTVVSGTLRAKQRVIGLTGMDGEVQSVEANLLDVEGGVAQSALTFHYRKRSELERWQSLVAEGALLTLGAP